MGAVSDLALPHTRHFSSPHGVVPRTQLLSNGRHAVMITAAGSGYSRWQDLAITRWREDATRDDTWSYILLRDVASGERWSAGFEPSLVPPESYKVSFSEHVAVFIRRDGTITTRLEVVVSWEDDAEVRQLSLTNHGLRTRDIEVTSHAEIVLAPAAADAAHPAFSSLFIQTEGIPVRQTLLATRRRQAPNDAEIWLAHVLAVDGETIGELEWETDRGQFLGRGRGIHDPFAVTDAVHLSNAVGSVLDPIITLRRRVRVHPGQTVRLAFSTMVAPSRDAVLDLARRYGDITTFARIATVAGTRAHEQLLQLGIAPEDASLFQELSGVILFANRSLRAPADVLARQVAGVEALWAHKISGDQPIVLVEIDEADDIGIVRELLLGQVYWRTKRLAVDLVILNARQPSDAQELQTLLEALVQTSQPTQRPDGSESQGNAFALRADRVTAAQRDVLMSVARAQFSSRRGTLAEQLACCNCADDATVTAPRPHPTQVTTAPALAKLPPALEFFNGLGGFDADGREYMITLRAGQWTPAPWSRSGTATTWPASRSPWPRTSASTGAARSTNRPAACAT
ncbi:MAG: hypothetical protein ABIU54_01945 [Candidatus Eisenbacteria bacterium]